MKGDTEEVGNFRLIKIERWSTDKGVNSYLNAGSECGEITEGLWLFGMKRRGTVEPQRRVNEYGCMVFITGP